MPAYLSIGQKSIGYSYSRLNACPIKTSPSSRHNRHVLVLIIALTGITHRAHPLLAQVDLSTLRTSTLPKTSTQPTFQSTVTPTDVAPGDEVRVSIRVNLPTGYYIYDANPDRSPHTHIEINHEGLIPLDTRWKAQEPGTDEVDETNQKVVKFYNQVTWERRFRVVDSKQSSPPLLVGRVEGQYCSPAELGGQCFLIRPPWKFEHALAWKHAPHTEISRSQREPNPAKPDVSENRVTQHDSPQNAIQQLLEVRPKRTRGNQSQDDPISFIFRLIPDETFPDRVILEITATPDSGWHFYSTTQSAEYAAPTVIELTHFDGLVPIDDGFKASQPPTVRQTTLGPLEEYHHSVTWSRTLRLTTSSIDSCGVKGTISYAVCDEQRCLPVHEVTFELGHITSDGPPDAIGEGEKSPFVSVTEDRENQAHVDHEKQVLSEGARTPPFTTTRIPHQGDFLAFLLLCMTGGFLALLTPCSFPMVPITVGFFLKQSEKGHERPWLLALVYCVTIVLTFTVLGVGTAAIFGVLKLNEFANLPWLNHAIGIIFVIFALNMLGLFEFQVPSSWLNWAARHQGSGSYAGAIFMGLAFTLTSFTCTFAIAGALLAGAARGEFYWSILGMLAFGTAFASPFFVLAMVPQWVSKLPRSGGWMNTIKVVLGILELGAAIKFFSIADPQQVVFDHLVVMLLWMVLSIVTAFYLFGWFRLPHDGELVAVSVPRMLFATGFLFMAGMLTWGLVRPESGGGWLMNQILAFAPPRLDSSEGDMGPIINHHGLVFALDVDRAIPIAKQRNMPLLLDFTGVNCANCRYMERLMAQPEWKRRLSAFISVQLYVDVERVPGITDELYARKVRVRNVTLFEQLFPAGGMPSYAIMTPDGQQLLAAFEGAERADRPGSFLRFLEEGALRWEQLKNHHSLSQRL